MGQPGAGDAASRLAEHIGQREGTGGTETSHVPRGRESIPGVVANETGAAQTVILRLACRRWDGGVGRTIGRRGSVAGESQTGRLAERRWKGRPQRVRVP
jgi:hypothetical protein